MYQHSRSNARRAFTLVEMLIVVSIIGLAGAIVVPQMLTAGTMGVQAAARMVIADILLAQNEAIANQSTRKIKFDEANNLYRITDSSDTPIQMNWLGGDGSYIVDFDDRTSQFGRVKIINVNFGDDAEIVFDALGAPSTGGTIDLQFQEINYRITVAAFTGRVTVAKL